MPLARRRLAAMSLGGSACIGLFSLAFTKAGQYLVVDRPTHSDFIVVLAEDFNDDRAELGLKLLREGYADQFLLDAPHRIHYGRNQTEAASDFLHSVAPEQSSRVHICSISPDSRLQEISQIGPCIQQVAPNATSGLLVTSDYLTRRSLSNAQSFLPRYKWSVAAAHELDLGPRWWRNRESAKIVLTEWQRLLWWLAVEHWKRAEPLYRSK